MGLKSILMALLLSVPCFGQVSIEGPESVLPGQFIRLQASSQDGFWLPDPELAGDFIECENQFGTSILQQGTFYFHYIVVDETGPQIALHRVVVSGADPCDPAEPEDPVEDPSTDQQFSKVIEASYEGAKFLQDANTASRLVTAIESVTPGQTLQETALKVTSAVEEVFLTRPRDRPLVNWLEFWRQPLNREIEALEITDSETYLKVMAAVATGLKKSLK